MGNSYCLGYQYLLGKVSTYHPPLPVAPFTVYQYLLGKVSTRLVLPPVVAPPHTCQYQYLLGKVSTIKDDILTDFERVVYQYLLGKVSTF